MALGLFGLLGVTSAGTGQTSAAPVQVNTADLDREIREFLDRQVAAHVQDIKSLDPPPDRVVGALTTGEFSWGTFMRALAAYSDLAKTRTVASRDVTPIIAKMGLIELHQGGKTWAQLYAALALRHFGTDLNHNALWQSLPSADRAAWKSLLDPRLQMHPNDRSLLLQTAAEAEAEGDLPRARRAFRTLLDSGNALADDYNMYAWLSLFDEQVDDQALEAAQQANLLSKNSNYAYLHTLACLDAARGETAEARQLLLEAMSTGNLEVPNSAIWYGFGRIYEEYGVNDAAAAAYQRVERPDGVIDPTGTFVLAQSRLKALHAN